MYKFDNNGCNNATDSASMSFTGNIIPHSWYKKITNSRGKPDLSSITILAEIVYWYRPQKDGSKKFNDDIWKTSYNYFIQKFGYNRQKLRRTFVKLEELGIIRRDVRHTEFYGHKYGNVLFIELIDQSFIAPDKKISPRDIKNKATLLQNCSNNIDKKNRKEENRSIFTKFSKAENLKDFHPITEDDLRILNKSSGRSFTLNAVNQILLSMSKKLPGRSFKTKRSFLNYMSKALASEMRQAESVNNSDFYITKNLSEKEIEKKNIEKYLSVIEESKSTKLEDSLKKKIIAIFEPEKAYQIIRNINIKVDSKEGIKVFYDKDFLVSDYETNLIYQEIKLILGKDNIFSLEAQPDIWQNIRNNLKESLGEDIDRSWFSKLKAEFNTKNKTLSLKADTQFIATWIENHYGNIIKNITENFGFKLLKMNY